jgi:hypothetical protein
MSKKTPSHKRDGRRRSNGTPTEGRSTFGAKTRARPNCRHCGAPDCTAHCQATKSGQHEVEAGDMHVADADPTVVVVEIFCDRCGDRAKAVVVESNFTWEGQWREEPSCLEGRRTR